MVANDALPAAVELKPVQRFSHASVWVTGFFLVAMMVLVAAAMARAASEPTLPDGESDIAVSLGN